MFEYSFVYSGLINIRLDYIISAVVTNWPKISIANDNYQSPFLINIFDNLNHLIETSKTVI